MASFKTSLEDQETRIRESVDHLNNSLRQIDFNHAPETYLQLSYDSARTPRILEFRRSLREWQPDLAAYELNKDDHILEQSFEKIHRIVTQLQEDETYRREVTDVRNWLSFKARECYREGDELKRLYETTAELSGGQKAQLTYTILSSALAYQFGITQNQRGPSFRFITVDEAFSKLDETRSRYLMDLCQQLKLQLLVVTPLDKIQVVDPYISACHWAVSRDNRESVLYHLPIEVYREKKAALQAGIAVDSSTLAE